MNSRWMAFCSFPLCGRQPLAHPNPILYTSILHIGKIRGRKVTRLYNIRMQAEVYRILVLASKEEVVACRDQRMVVGEDQGVQEVQEVEEVGVYGMSFSLKPSVANTLVFNFICGNVTKASSVHKMKNRTSYIRVDKKEEV
uniref:Uncharacterized protein n=1 Tax=Populus trichocarpa TaxID=3694 RepID=A0A2K1X6T9_POPTR